MSQIRTFTGRLVDPLAMRQEDLAIEDVAHALARICRFGGHVREFYSVGQHSLLVAAHVRGRRMDAAWGLLHDASEAYLGDVVTPIKRLYPDYYEAEERLMRVVAAKWGLTWPMPAVVHAADRGALATEQRDLMTGAELDGDPWPHRIRVMPAAAVEEEFLRAFGMYVHGETWI